MKKEELERQFNTQINTAPRNSGRGVSPSMKGIHKHMYFYLLMSDLYLNDFKEYVEKYWLKKDRYAEYFKGNGTFCVKMSYDIEW